MLAEGDLIMLTRQDADGSQQVCRRLTVGPPPRS